MPEIHLRFTGFQSPDAPHIMPTASLRTARRNDYLRQTDNRIVPATVSSWWVLAKSSSHLTCPHDLTKEDEQTRETCSRVARRPTAGTASSVGTRAGAGRHP